jgi:hypothetical protein
MRGSPQPNGRATKAIEDRQVRTDGELPLGGKTYIGVHDVAYKPNALGVILEKLVRNQPVSLRGRPREAGRIPVRGALAATSQTGIPVASPAIGRHGSPTSRDIMNRKMFGLMAVVGSALGAWWWSAQRRTRSSNGIQAREHGTVIFDNTPTASDVDAVI